MKSCYEFHTTVITKKSLLDTLTLHCILRCKPRLLYYGIQNCLLSM